MNNQFSEYQFLTQHKAIKWIFRISFPLYIVAILIGLMLHKGISETLILIFIFTLLLYFLLNKLGMKTKVNTTALSVNHPFVGSFTISITEIASVESITFNFPNNRRTFHKKFGTLYRMYGNKGVSIETQGRRRFFIGSQKADVLQHVIQHK